MNIPIVLAAFGTTSRAKDIYALLETRVKSRFPDHDIRWALTSRRVHVEARKYGQAMQRRPSEVLEALRAEGHRWAVVQSLHVVAGHEFDRLIDEIRACSIRTSVGIPLLSSYADHWKTTQALQQVLVSPSADEAVVLIGHGTDHPAWAAYLALESICRKRFGPHVFVGLIEGKPGRTATMQAVRKAGYRRVHLIPLTLVAGVHFEEDIAGSDGWAAAFLRCGIDVRVTSSGIGQNEGIIDIFFDHIAQALDVIPK